MRTTISFVDFGKIDNSGEEGALMMRLAIAVNNFMSTDYLFSEARQLREDRGTKDFGVGVGMLLIAIQIGYLNEALLLVANPNGPELTLDTSISLHHLLETLSPEGRQAYLNVRRLIDDPAERCFFQKRVEGFRNRAAFHYDTGYRGRSPREVPVTTRAIKGLAKKRAVGKWIRPHRRTDLNDRDVRRFEFADTVMDTAVCREIWGIGDEVTTENLVPAADKIIDWIYDYTKSFVAFTSELCQRYFADKLV